MSNEQYVTHQRRVDEEISKRFYAHGLVPPGVTPMPSAVARLEPPFSRRARGNADKDLPHRDRLAGCPTQASTGFAHQGGHSADLGDLLTPTASGHASAYPSGDRPRVGGDGATVDHRGGCARCLASPARPGDPVTSTAFLALPSPM